MDEKFAKKYFVLDWIFKFILIIDGLFRSFKRDFLVYGFYSMLIFAIVFSIYGIKYRNSMDRSFKMIYLLQLIVSIGILCFDWKFI